MSNVSFSGNLVGYQQNILNSSARFTVTQAGTKTGKTYSHLYWLFKKAHEVPEGYERYDDEEHIQAGRNYWWVAPVYKQSKIAYRRLWRICSRISGYKKNESELTITTPYGSIVTFVTADNPDNLYGEDVYAAVFDEFTRAKQEAWYALRSTLTATNGECKFIGNYTGQANWGNQLYVKAKKDPEYSTYRITAWDAVKAGILKESEILQAQKDLPAFMFKALYLAEGDIDQARLVEDEAITDLFTNDFVKPGKERYMTVDVAFQGSDKFVAWIWEGFKAVKCHIIPKTDGAEIEKAIKGYATKYKIPRSHIAYDADGVGTFLKGYLKGAISFHNGAAPIKEAGEKMEYKNLKSQCYFKMADRINDAGYHVACDLGPNHLEFIEELEVVKNRSHGTDGKLEVLRKKEIKEYIGRSPDFTDSFMMREYFALKKRKRPKTRVGNMRKTND